jgi:hypothetical protein
LFSGTLTTAGADIPNRQLARPLIQRMIDADFSEVVP